MAKQNGKIWISIILALVLLIGAMLYLGYGNSTDPASLAVKQLALIRLVGRHAVTSYDLIETYSIAKRLDPSVTRAQTLRQLIKNEQFEAAADKHGIRLNSDAISDEMAYLKNERGEEYHRFIRDYFNGNEWLFERYIAEPLAWEAAVRIHYNSDQTFNSKAMEKAQNILDQVKSGENFETIAKQESDDNLSGQLGGDLGFTAHGQLLPELESQIVIAPVGKVIDKVLVSRLGYHIVFPVETANDDGKKLWHVKHILIKTEGFDSWFSNETGNVKIIKIGKE